MLGFKSKKWNWVTIAVVLLVAGFFGYRTAMVTAESLPRPSQRAVAAVAVVDSSIAYQGRLVDSSGSPVNGVKALTFRLYDASSGGNLLSSSSQTVSLSNGVFNANISVPQWAFDGRALWLEVQVDGESSPITPRQKIQPVPYALGIVPGARISTDRGWAALSGYSSGSHIPYGPTTLPQARPLSATTNPSIFAVLGSTLVSGYTSPAAAVSATLKSTTGQAKATATTNAMSSGYYYLNFPYPDGRILPGDVVEVSAAGNTVKMTVVDLSVLGNTITDTVSGQAPAGANVVLEVYPTWCSSGASVSLALTANQDGHWSVYRPGGRDIVSGTYFWLFTPDANGNGTQTWGWAAPAINSLVAGSYSVQVTGYSLLPGEAVDIKVRGADGTLKGSRTAWAGTTGSGSLGRAPYYFWAIFPQSDLPGVVTGDRLAVAVDGTTLQLSVPSLTIALDTSYKTVSGTFPGGGAPGVYVYHWTGSSYSYYYGSVSTSGTSYLATFTQPGFDLVAGDNGVVCYGTDGGQFSRYGSTTSVSLSGPDVPASFTYGGAPINASWTIAGNGVRVTWTNLRWDTVSRPNLGYRFGTPSAVSGESPGSMGRYTGSFLGPLAPRVYVRAYAWVDGQALWSPEVAITNTIPVYSLYLPAVAKNATGQ